MTIIIHNHVNKQDIGMNIRHHVKAWSNLVAIIGCAITAERINWDTNLIEVLMAVV